MSIELNSDSMFASPRREGEGSTYVGWRNPELAEGCGRVLQSPTSLHRSGGPTLDLPPNRLSLNTTSAVPP